MDYVDMIMPGGGKVRIQTIEATQNKRRAGTGTASIGGSKVEKTQEKIEEFGKVSETAASVAKNMLDGMVNEFEGFTPAEIGLEFSVGLSGNVGIPVVASGSVDAAFKVSVKWEPNGED